MDTETETTITAQIAASLKLAESYLHNNVQGWSYEFSVDLEHLQDGNIDKTFRVDDVHESQNGMSGRQYHGIVKTYRLPDGVAVSEIVDLCTSIWDSREELTDGLSVVWDGNDWVSRWENGLPDFWAYDLQNQVYDLVCQESYDLSDGAYYLDIKEALEERAEESGANLDDRESVEKLLEELYPNGGELKFFGHYDFVEQYMESRTAEEAE